MLWQFVIIVIVIWRGLHRWKNSKLYAIYNQMKSQYKQWPLVGHALKFLGNDEVQMKAIHDFGREAMKMGGMSSFWLGEYLAISVSDPEIAEFVLKTCLEKGDIMSPAKFILGNGSVFAPVPLWRPRRKILVPTFSPKNLNQFVNIFAKQSDVMVELLQRAVGRGPFSIWDYITTYTMDSVTETTLGIKLDAQHNPNHPFIKNFDDAVHLVTTRILCPWLHNNVVYRLTQSYRTLKYLRDYMINFVSKIIKEKREQMAEEQIKNRKQCTDEKHVNTKTFLELLIDSSGGERGYSDVELREEILVLVMAGTDTSAVGAAFTMLMLAHYQHVQDKVYNELKEVYGDSTRPVVPEDLPQLKYMDAVIKESLRMYPPAPVIMREVDKDVTLPSGLTLVPGCLVLVHIWAILRNPSYWGPDAEQFRPERFIDTEMKHPAQFITFSNGPRNCPGYQYALISMKTALSTILRRYRILPATARSPAVPTAQNRGDSDRDRDSAQDEHPSLRLKYHIMMKDVDNFTVQLEPRV